MIAIIIGIVKALGEHATLDILGGASRASWKPLDGAGNGTDVCLGGIIRARCTICFNSGLFGE
jgi:hypothetical protein